ncbi:MAG: nodulation protein NfeD [Candidatus Omnitrophota bacterium]
MSATKRTILVLSALFFIIFASPAAPQGRINNSLLVLTLDNKIIGPVIADYVSRGIDKANKENYSGIILIMDTPGGLLESTRFIVKKIMNAPIPVITYVAPSGSRAGSAGVFIALASHIVAMAPSTNIGAAHPVILGEGEKSERSLKRSIEELTDTLNRKKAKSTENKTQGSENPMEDKIMNDTLAWITAIAKNRNRNADWARQAVLESVSATEKEALEKKVIDLIANDLPDLLKKLDGRMISSLDKTITLNTKDARLVYFDLTLSQNILNTLINPNLAYIFMLMAFLGLFIEFTHPGVIFPGIVGAISLILAFYGFAVLPINFAGFLLIALAIILFIAEALTPATFGLMTLAGAVSMLIGSLMLVDSSFLGIKISLNIIFPFILSIATIVIFLVMNVVKTHNKKALSGASTLIGVIGVAQTDLNPEGQVFVAGEIWTAFNPSGETIRKGEKIKVLGVDNIKLSVSKYKA